MLVGAIIWRFLSGWKRHFYDSSLLEQLMGDLSSTSLDSSRRLLGHPHNMTQLPQNKAFQRDQRVNFHGLISEVTDNPVHHILFVRSKSLSPVCTPVQDAWLLEGSTTEDFVQFSSVQSLSHVQLFVTPWTAACQASLSFTISQRLLKFMSIVLVMPSNHLIPCRPLPILPSIFPSIRVFSNESVLLIQVAKVLEFQFIHISI